MYKCRFLKIFRKHCLSQKQEALKECNLLVKFTHGLIYKIEKNCWKACVNFAKHLVAGNTLESFDTTSLEKSEEGTRLITEPNGNNSEELVNPQAII